MKIFFAGATGFLGRALALRLRRDGHTLVAWVRDPIVARRVLGSEPELVATAIDDAALAEVIAGCDAVINLAGAPIARRWGAAVRQEIVESRVAVTERIAAAVTVAAASGRAPRTWLQGSAVGIYGDRGDDELDESSPPGAGFLAELCQRWEAAAMAVRLRGVRVACMRIGVVLGRDGGMLAAMLPTAQLGLGGTLGAGRQYVPWIHIDDCVELFATALGDTRYVGAIDACAPTPQTNRTITKTLGRVLHRPALARVPAAALRLALGEAAAIVLDSARVRPARALALGFAFRFPELEPALRDLLVGGEIRISPAGVPPDAAYLRERTPRWCLEMRSHLGADLDEVFAFFSRPENLGAMTPGDMGFVIQGEIGPQMFAGMEIAYRIHLGRLPLRWRTRIDAIDDRDRDRKRFVDVQLVGPYASWFHEHEFIRQPDGGTLMIDRVWYAPPLGPLGTIAQRLFVAPALRRIFAYRAQRAALRFGGPTRAHDHVAA